MTAAAVRALVERYWRALDARAWEALAETLSPEVVYEVPQTGERVRGRDGYVDFNATFPGAWRIEPLRLVADDRGAFGQVLFVVSAARQTALTWFEVGLYAGDGPVVTRIEEYWPEPYEPPARASRYVERFTSDRFR